MHGTEVVAGAAENWAKERTISAEQRTAIDGRGDFEWLVREHARFLFSIAYSVLRNRADAEDAVQDAFLRVFRSGEYGNVNDLRAWLARIVWRTAIDRVPRRREVSLDDTEQEITVVAEGQSLDDALVETQRIAIAHKLIAGLPDDLRETLVLSTVKEMSSAQIAEVLQIPEASVRTRLFRARQVLKQKLAAVIGK